MKLCLLLTKLAISKEILDTKEKVLRYIRSVEDESKHPNINQKYNFQFCMSLIELKINLSLKD